MSGADDEKSMLNGQAETWKHMFHFADFMTLKCAAELRIADIIRSHGRPITLSQIASGIDFPTSPDTTCLHRIMRLLVRNNIFTSSSSFHESGCGAAADQETVLYGLTPSSKWLLHDSELSLVPMLQLQNHPLMRTPWNHLSSCVKEGGIPFKKAHGRGLWDMASANPEFSKILNDAMKGTSKVMREAIISGYGEGFSSIGSIVDVGGGTGAMVAEIVRAHPHIKGINFDLPHVVVTAPQYAGVSHVGGDLFEDIPAADAVFMKWILHTWEDEDCVRILKNCRKAIPEKTGKIIIVDVVLKPEGDGIFDKIGIVFDVLMMAVTGGKERTEIEWKRVLEGGGFPRYNIIEIPALVSIIEAFPE